MAHENHVDLPDDFDALLRQTMSAEPSAEFLPRVRDRIPAQPPRFFSWWRFAVVAGPAAAAALVLVLWTTPEPALVIIPPAPVAPSAPRVAVTPLEPTVPVIASAPKPRAVPRWAPARSPRTPARVVVPQREAEVVVMVDERQRAALAMLMRLVGDGRLTDEAFAQTTPQSMGAIREQVFPVNVAPVVVSPIAVGGVLWVGAERN